MTTAEFNQKMDEARAAFATMPADQKVYVQIDARIGGDKIEIRGRVLAQRKSRDSKVVLDKGVTVCSGRFPDWGGSVKNPHLDADKGTRIEFEASQAMYFYIADEIDCDATWSLTPQTPVAIDPLPTW